MYCKFIGKVLNSKMSLFYYLHVYKVMGKFLTLCNSILIFQDV